MTNDDILKHLQNEQTSNNGKSEVQLIDKNSLPATLGFDRIHVLMNTSELPYGKIPKHLHKVIGEQMAEAARGGFQLPDNEVQKVEVVDREESTQEVIVYLKTKSSQYCSTMKDLSLLYFNVQLFEIVSNTVIQYSDENIGEYIPIHIMDRWVSNGNNKWYVKSDYYGSLIKDSMNFMDEWD